MRMAFAIRIGSWSQRPCTESNVNKWTAPSAPLFGSLMTAHSNSDSSDVRGNPACCPVAALPAEATAHRSSYSQWRHFNMRGLGFFRAYSHSPSTPRSKISRWSVSLIPRPSFTATPNQIASALRLPDSPVNDDRSRGRTDNDVHSSGGADERQKHPHRLGPSAALAGKDMSDPRRFFQRNDGRGLSRHTRQ
jgi:hypothetical protein